MPVDPTMLYSTVRLIGDVGEQAQRRGVIGTGFLVTVVSESVSGLRYPYVVTADHVVSWQSNVELQIPDPLGRGDLYEPMPLMDWHQPLPEVDLALAPVARVRGQTWQPLELETDLIPDDSGWLFLGANVHYIGILVPLDRPMVRTGTIGAIDQKGIPYGEDVPKEYGDYPLHLLDCRSYEGFSGSPCYLDMPFPILTPGTMPPHRAPPAGIPQVFGNMYHVSLLCGMLIEHLDDRKESGAASPYGVGLMLRGNEIRKALMADEMQERRRKLDTEENEGAKSGPTRTQLSRRRAASAPETEFGRFEDLTRKLVRTPKQEIDEQREREREREGQ